MGLASASFFGQGDISPPLWAAATRRHPHYSEMQIDLEAMHPTEDSNLLMTSFMAAPHDPGRASAHASGLSSELPSLWWGSKGLLPPLFPMLVGSGGMAGGCGGPPLRDTRGGVLELLVERLLQAGGRLEADFRHAVGNLDPQERGRLQGHHPIRRCHYTHCRGVLSFLATRRRRPLELCTPAMIDLVVMLFIHPMEIGGTVWGASLPL